MRSLLPVPLVLVALAACSSGGNNPPAPESSGKPNASGTAVSTGTASGTAVSTGTATATATATATGSAAAVPEGPPVCKRSNERVWSSGANKLTGLTTKVIDGKFAVGLAIGNDPRVLVIDKGGETKLFKVRLGAKAKMPEGKEALRSLMRVSPRSLEGEEARAFIDYRDDYKDKRRHVWCGPADADDKFLEFFGTSWMDLDPKPTGEEKTKKYFSWKKLGGYVELRDCRTFVTQKDNEVWALGSVLRGIEKSDGTTEWKMVFLVDFGQNDDEIVLHEAPLKGDPPKLATFEIPNSRRVKDKGFLIATRFGGSLMVGVLDQDRKLKGKFKSYRGFPSMPDIGADEQEMILTVGIGIGKDRSLKGLRIPRDTLSLPEDYTPIKLSPSDNNEGETAFNAPEVSIDTSGQRWLTYIEGPPNKGHLRVVPLGKDLHPIGRSFAVTDGDIFAAEGRLATLEDGRMEIVYLRDKDGKTELVSEKLACEVKK